MPARETCFTTSTDRVTLIESFPLIVDVKGDYTNNPGSNERNCDATTPTWFSGTD
jgi:hypothetical protein